MAGTKKKNSKGKAPSRQPKQPKPAAEAYLEGLQHLPPQDHVAAVKPLWETLTNDQRTELLTVDLDELRSFAKDVAERTKLNHEWEAAQALRVGQVICNLEPPVDEVLNEGLARSAERGTWKVWSWPPEGMEFYDSDAFRKFLHENLLNEKLLEALPREDPGAKIAERPAEAALRQRMADLVQRITEQRNAHEENMARQRPAAGRRQAADPVGVARDIHVDLITTVLGALEREHEALYHHCLYPVCSYVCDILSEESRKTTNTELHFEDLDQLMPEDVARIYDFLSEKVDALSTKLKPEAKELEAEAEADDGDEEPIGDVDLFSLTEGPQPTAATVNAKWLSHLQSRVLSEDGQPRRAKQEDDPYNMGLVLEWVYGTIVSTAEKARDSAHRALGSHPPSAEAAVEALIAALEEQVMWETRAKASKEILADMLVSRKEYADLEEQYDLRIITAPPPAPSAIKTSVPATQDGEVNTDDEEDMPPSLPPDDVIVKMLKREALLTAAKLHHLGYENQKAQRSVRSLSVQLRQGEPQYERLRRELDDLKAAPARSLEGTYRSAAEMERARKQLADATVEEQIHVQAAVRQTGARLQKILDTRSTIEMELARINSEITQLTNWRNKVLRLAGNIEDAVAAAAPLERAAAGIGANGEVDEEAGEINDAQRALIAAVKSATHQEAELENLRGHFRKDMSHQLYTINDDILQFGNIKGHLKEVEQKLDDGRVALQHLEAYVLNVACDDPGITIGNQIILPFLQQKLDSKALEYAAKKAAAALDEVIEMELKDADRQRLEKEKKAKAKQKAKEKVRSEKERERADIEARELAAKAKAEEEIREAAQKEEEARRRKAEELEQLRRTEEELMEKRRQELLADKGSYWQQRAAQEELEEELLRGGGGEEGSSADDTSAAGGNAKEGEEGFVPATSKAATRRAKPSREASSKPPKEAKANGRERVNDRIRKTASKVETARPAPSISALPAAASQAKVDDGRSARVSTPPLQESTSASLPAPATLLAPASPEPLETAPTALPLHPMAANMPQTPTQQIPAPVALPTMAPPPLQQQQQQQPHALPAPPRVLPMAIGMPLPPAVLPPLPHQMHLPPGVVIAPPPPPPPRPNRSPSAGDESSAPHQQPPMNLPPFPQGAYPPGMPHHMMFFPPPGAPGPGPHMSGMPPPHMMGANGHMGPPGGHPGAYMHMHGGGPSMGMPPPPHMSGMHPSMGMPPHMGGPPGGGGGPASGSLGQQGMQHSGQSSGLMPPTAKQLRAAAPSFVPSTIRSASSSSAEPPPKNTSSGAEDQSGAGDDGSPRGILEKSDSVSATVDEVASSKSNPGSDNGLSISGVVAQSSHGVEVAVSSSSSSRDTVQVQVVKVLPPATLPAAVPAVPLAQLPAAFKPEQQQMMRALVHGFKQQKEPKAVDVRLLKRTRGLTNAPGLYNCFLNVIIQSLWHLPSVRHAVLALRPDTAAPSSSDARVLSSLLNVFRALDNETSAPNDAALPPPPVSPRELREALSSTAAEAAARFELSDMHDAAEVLGELLSRLHLAEAAPGSKDPTLPERVRVTASSPTNQSSPRTPAAPPLAGVSSPASEGGSGGSPPGAGSVWGDQAALKKVRRAPAMAGESKSRTTALRLFGIEVQSPSGETPRSKSLGTLEVLQYAKYFHLVSAKGLRLAAQSAPDFESALLTATGQAQGPSDRLLTPPLVFTLSLVWDAPQVPVAVLDGTFAALKPELDISRLFIDADEGLTYSLRSVVCYSSAHYCVFAFSEEAGCWLLVDDAEVSAVGSWMDVGRAVCARRLQPSLLFYESTQRGAQQEE